MAQGRPRDMSGDEIRAERERLRREKTMSGDEIRAEQERLRREREAAANRNKVVTPPVIGGGGVNLRGPQTALERSLLKTGTERRAGRVGFYDTLRNLRRQQKGTESQMGAVAAESGGNRRSPAFASGVGQVRANTVAGLVKAMRDRATSEASLVERDRAAREQFEKAVVDQYWARAKNMDARAREFLKTQIFDNLNINVDEVVNTMTGEK